MSTPPPLAATAAATAAAVVTWTPELEMDYQNILSVGEECISSNELKTLLLQKGRHSSSTGGCDNNKNENKIILYDGFEPSGRMHIAQGVFKAMNVNKCTVSEQDDTDNGTSTSMNTKFVFWVADWFALMNDKMGGDLFKIQKVGDYLIQVWKAAGMKLQNVTFLWASTEITKHAAIYWPIMLDITRRFTITRIKKCCQIMGRYENSLTSAQILYPLMQCTDIFFLKADICQLGVDQRKVNMLAREYCDAVSSSDKKAKKKPKPIILSHHMLYGLKAGQAKMSKSDPDSAIFMEDTLEDVERKIMNAYCPTISSTASVVATSTETTTSTLQDLTISGSSTTTTNDATVTDDDAGKESMQLIEDTLKNPCLDYIKYIIFSPPNATFTITKEEEEDGTTITTTTTKVYDKYEQVQTDFLKGSITEQQLKRGLIQQLNLLLQPVRDEFTNNPQSKQLLELVQQYKKEDSSTSKEKDKIKSIVRRLDYQQLQLQSEQQQQSDHSTTTATVLHHLVFAPLPTIQPTLQSVIDTVQQIRSGIHELQTQLQKQQQSQSQSNSHTKIVILLFLQDWSALVTNSCQSDVKTIQAFYSLYIAALQSYAPDLFEKQNTNVQVQILYQSEMILLDPSNYWISVINIGRHFILHEIMGSSSSSIATTTDGKKKNDDIIHDEDNVGLVVARLMKLADVISIVPATVTSSSPSSKSTTSTTISIEDELIRRTFVELFSTLPVPVWCTTTSNSSSSNSSSRTNQPVVSIQLQPQRENDALRTENDEYYLLDDPKVHGKSKLKKSFCEPGNIKFCPPIALATVLALSSSPSSSSSTFVVQRSEANGGNKTYTSREELENDFLLGESVLHPGDLKNSVTPYVLQLLDKIQGTIQKDSNLVNAMKLLKQQLKKKK